MTAHFQNFFEQQEEGSLSLVTVDFSAEISSLEWEFIAQLRGISAQGNLVSSLTKNKRQLPAPDLLPGVRCGNIVSAEPHGKGRGTAWRIKLSSGREVLLRFFRRGGFMRYFVQDCFFCSPFVSLKESRPFLEMELLLELYAAGVKVPYPIAARSELSPRVGKFGIGYRGLIITEFLQGTCNLLELVEQLPQENFLSICQQSGKLAKLMLNHCVTHADLHLGNVLLGTSTGAERDVYLVDLDKAWRYKKGTRDAQELYLQDRWERSLRKHFPGQEQLITRAYQAFSEGLHERC